MISMGSRSRVVILQLFRFYESYCIQNDHIKKSNFKDFTLSKYLSINRRIVNVKWVKFHFICFGIHQKYPLSQIFLYVLFKSTLETSMQGYSVYQDAYDSIL